MDYWYEMSCHKFIPQSNHERLRNELDDSAHEPIDDEINIDEVQDGE